ncbi:hypothetical protein KDN32_06595 [Nocardioides sp. J2M5]|uniref:hypothetical protein n=1 Tax=Nocardioides palaemonis TaxID=2829810 RepID=UPI001BAA3AE5|nr:hypothetical protein [Nocardioides palaemonis]MBS2937405.1 hypothetical protein [Nocardioides palaemonis]
MTLSGTVGAEPGATTSVLYVIDATSSTGRVPGLDCSGNGAVGAEDDLNGDGSVGDVLDCEVAGVLALNRSLATTTGVQAGVVAFANQAAAADLDPVGSATFLAPAFTGGDAAPRVETVVRSVQRSRIGLYDPRDLGASGSGSAFSGAVSTALATLATAPAGPKWIMFLSDGQSGIDDAQLAALSGSGVRMRTFGIGAAATCDRRGSLFKMAAATGEACVVEPDPTSLAAQLTGSQPDAVSGVTVTIGSTAVAATVDAVGGWKAGFTLGAGTYTAQVRATLTSGRVQTTQRTFTVAAGDGTSPAPGTVTGAPGSLRATALKVTRPAPTRLSLPARVSGRVGRPVDGFSGSAALAGARVELQARTAAGTVWTTVAKTRAKRSGAFALRWKPRARWTVLRVALRPPSGFAESVAAVAQPAISACKVVGKKQWTVTCRTTAKARSQVRLLDGRTVVDRSRVRKGTLRLSGRGPVAGSRIVLGSGRRTVGLTL